MNNIYCLKEEETFQERLRIPRALITAVNIKRGILDDYFFHLNEKRGLKIAQFGLIEFLCFFKVFNSSNLKAHCAGTFIFHLRCYVSFHL